MYKPLFEKYIEVASSTPNSSGEYAAYCPFHTDTKPSLSFNGATGQWYCFGCDLGGTAETFVAKVTGLAYEEARRIVAEATAPVDQQTITKWHDDLTQSVAPLAYLRERGLLDWSVIKQYDIGYDGERITIPVYDINGTLLNVRRMATKKDKRKVINLPGSTAYLWPASNLEGDGPLILCAGESDCLSALVQGHRAITGTLGETGWSENWNQFFVGQDVTIIYDGDAAGRKGTAKVLENIQDVARVSVVRLPDGMDINEFHKQGVQISALLAEAERVVNDTPSSLLAEMEALPADVDMQERLTYVERLRNVSVGVPEIELEMYLESARKALKVPKQILRAALKPKKESTSENSAPTPLDEPQPIGMSLAQDYRNDSFWYGVWLPTDAQGEQDYLFRLVTDARRFVEPPADSEDSLPPPDLIRWSIDKRTPYNVFSWVSGETPAINVRELFAEIKEAFDRFMWYPQEGASTALTLWAMTSYVFMAFDATPYLALTGNMQSGKSRTLEILDALCFNAVKAAAVSAASIYRSVSTARNVLLFDESDVLSANKVVGSGGVDERLAIVLDGYRKGGKSIRAEGENFIPKLFYTYSPKAFASMSALPETVTNRAVMVQVQRKSVDVTLDTLIWADEEDAFQLIRNKLYCFGMEYAKKLAKQRRDITHYLKTRGIVDREAEIWTIPVSIAKLVGDDILEDVVAYATGCSSAAKAAADNEDSARTAAIWSCYTLLTSDDTEHQPVEVDKEGRKWYLRRQVRALMALHSERPVELILPSEVRQELLYAGIIDAGIAYSKQVRLGPYRGQRVYRLDSERVINACIRYNVVLDAELVKVLYEM